MADSWSVTNLGQLLSGLNSQIDSIISSLNQGVSKIQQTLGTVNTRLDSVNATLLSAKTFFNKLQDSGFYVILLEPGGPGSWASRLTSAANAPAQGAYFTAGACIIIEAPTLAPVVAKFSEMIDILASPLP